MRVLKAADLDQMATTGKQIWRGDTIRKNLPTDWLKLSDEVVNLAYVWHWEPLLSLLVQARDQTGCCWANCWRLREFLKLNMSPFE